jgi:hypothetical protein
MIAAGLVATTARISYALMMAATLFGYILRLGIVALAVMLVRNETWVDLMALGLTLIVTHLGLLFWEMRYVSASLAFPGLRPTASASSESISNEDISATTEKATV